MALNWNPKRIENEETVCWEGEAGKETMRWQTNSLIWLLMAVDVGEITKKNLDEVWDRIHTWEAVNGSMSSSPERDLYMTRADVERHVGLVTNVSYRNKTAFKRKIADIALELALKKRARAEAGDSYNMIAVENANVATS